MVAGDQGQGWVVKPEHGYWIHRERPFAILFEKVFSKFWNRFVEPSKFGLLPEGYNKNVHGPYVPWRYYGKPDTPLKDVKLGDLPAWLRRRNMKPSGIASAYSRTMHYWAHRFNAARYRNAAYIWQVCFVFAGVMYAMRYRSLHSIHTKARYH